MIKFDGAHITEVIKKKKLYTRIAYVLLLPLIIGSVLSAVLTRDAVIYGKSEFEHIASLFLAIASLLAIIIIIIFFVVPANREINRCVCITLANGLLAREDLLTGSGKIEFSADYSGDVLTLSRKNFTGEISIDPARLTTADGLGGAGAKIEMDLKALKAVPALYATAGTKLWQFLQAYYLLHGKENGAQIVTITDNMGKTPLTLTVFPCEAPEKKNYFIEKELVK